MPIKFKAQKETESTSLNLIALELFWLLQNMHTRPYSPVHFGHVQFACRE